VAKQLGLSPPQRPQVKIPFDELEQWESIAKYFLGEAALEQRAEGGGNKKLIAEYLRDASKVLSYMAPYHHARLATIEHKFPPIDPARLSDDQLRALDALLTAATDDSGGAGETTH